MVKIIDSKEIKKAIIAVIKENIKGVNIVAENVFEPIERPFIKIIFENEKTQKLNSRCIEKLINCEIYYYCSDKYDFAIENKKIKEKIEEIFYSNLKVNDDFYIPIGEIESDVQEDVLICSFELYMIFQLPDNDSNEIMNELNVKLN